MNKINLERLRRCDQVWEEMDVLEDYSSLTDFVVVSKGRPHHRVWRRIKRIFKKKK